jgi:hypothetical protein
MKADTFAKLVVLETLVDAEIGQYLEHHPTSMDHFRENFVARISDRVDEIDALDAVAAARVYDALVDFLAELPDDDAGAVTATLRFKQAMARIVERGLARRDYEEPSTWAVVLDELLEELSGQYGRAVPAAGEIRQPEYGRAQVLLARAREVAERMLWTADAPRRNELREQMDRLTFAVRHQRLQPVEVAQLIRPAQRRVRRYRPSTLTRVGAFVLSQLVSRSKRSRTAPGSTEADPPQRRGRGESPAPA